MELWKQIWSIAFVVGILGNLTASAIIVLPQIRKLHKKLDRHHAEVMSHDNRSEV